MNIGPGETFEAVIETGTTGLVGTLELGILDNQGAFTAALDSDDIIETPAGSGVYAATRTAPTVKGQYTILWSLDGTTDPDQVQIEPLNVTFTALTAEPIGPTYATVAELSGLLKVSPTSYAASLTRVLVVATGEIDVEVARSEDNPLAGWELSLVTEVCLERATEHWHQARSPFGIVTLGEESGPMWTPRDSWDRHARKLAPLRERVGLA
jgi:hypothetical protein